jgi:DNA-binding transcriptional MocR family regulator
MNTPPPPEGVDFDDLLKQGLSQVLMGQMPIADDLPPGRGKRLRPQGRSQWLAPMFGALDAEQVVVCPGAQAAIAALILALTEPGDVILAEPAVIPACVPRRPSSAGASLRWKRTSTGWCPRSWSRRAASTSPGWSTSTRPCRTRPPSPCRTPAQGARQHRQRCHVRIVEDDPYWLLADAPPPPIATFAPEQVYYISTLSKCLTPGLRVAFVLILTRMNASFLVALRSFALMVAPLTAALATQWILDGSADGLMEGVRKEARLRHRMARDILAGRYSGAGDGLHVWLELPGYWSSSQLARAADSEGIAVTPAEAFATGSGSVNAIRISLGSIKDRGRLQAGLQRLSHLLARRPESFSAAVV